MNNIDELLKHLKEYKPEIKLDDNILHTHNPNLTDDFLFENIKSYNDVCHYLHEPLESLPYLQIKQIEKLFNGNWVKNFSNNQENWYPYFEYKKSSGCLGFGSSHYFDSLSRGQVAFYKSKKISDFIGKTFIDIYNKL